MDWTNPAPLDGKYIEAIVAALNERTIASGHPPLEITDIAGSNRHLDIDLIKSIQTAIIEITTPFWGRYANHEYNSGDFSGLTAYPASPECYWTMEKLLNHLNLNCGIIDFGLYAKTSNDDIKKWMIQSYHIINHLIWIFNNSFQGRISNYFSTTESRYRKKQISNTVFPKTWGETQALSILPDSSWIIGEAFKQQKDGFIYFDDEYGGLVLVGTNLYYNGTILSAQFEYDLIKTTRYDGRLGFDFYNYGTFGDMGGYGTMLTTSDFTFNYCMRKHGVSFLHTETTKTVKDVEDSIFDSTKLIKPDINNHLHHNLLLGFFAGVVKYDNAFKFKYP